MFVKKSAVLLSALLVISLLTACGKTEQKTPAAESSPAQASRPASQTSAPPLAAAPAGAVLGTAQYRDNPDLRCDLLEVKRVSGGAVRVTWKISNPSAKAIYYNFDWQDVYFIDPAENKKYVYLTDAEGGKIVDIFWGNLNPGEQKLSWAKFPEPPATSNKISISVGKFSPPFDDIPLN